MKAWDDKEKKLTKEQATKIIKLCNSGKEQTEKLIIETTKLLQDQKDIQLQAHHQMNTLMDILNKTNKDLLFFKQTLHEMYELTGRKN